MPTSGSLRQRNRESVEVVTVERDLATLLATMSPVVRPGGYVFVTVLSDADVPVVPAATVHEGEG